MARSAKTRTGRATDPAGPAGEAGIVDAEVIAETPPARPDPAMTVQSPTDDGARVIPSPAPEMAAEPAEAVVAEPVRPAGPGLQSEPVPAPAQVTVRRVGFLPVALGGVVAAGLGLAAGWQGLLPQPDSGETAAALAGQAGRIDELASAVAALPAAPDLAPLQAEVAALRDGLAPLSDRLAALEARMETLERAPAGDGTLSAQAMAAWQQDIAGLKAALAEQRDQTAALAETLAAREAALSGLREAMAAQQAEVTRMAEAAAERLDAAQSAVAGIEEQATASARATLRRAVQANIRTAVEEGRPFADLLDEFAATGAEVPADLSAAAVDGVASMAGLADSFPEAARAALAAARAEGVADGDGTGVMAFLRRQLDVRSVAPREGDDPDAILSRAEAALREARLNDALAEVMALPEVVRAPMNAWITAAETRIAALSALQALAETLPSPAPSN